MQPLQDLVRRQVEIRQCGQGGAQLAHGGGRVDGVPGGVTHGQRHPRPGERDDVEPAAAVAGGQVGVGGLHRRADRAGGLPQVALEDPRHRPLTAVQAGVVQAQRGPRGELLGERQVLAVEREGIAPAVEADQSEDDAPGAHRDHHHRVHPGGDDPAVPPAVRVQPGGVLVQVRDEHRGQVREGLPVRRADRVGADLADGRHALAGDVGQRAEARAAQRRVGEHRSGRGGLSAQYRVQHVHRHGFGEVRHHDVADLLRRAEDVQGGPDAGGGPVEQAQSGLGPGPVMSVMANATPSTVASASWRRKQATEATASRGGFSRLRARMRRSGTGLPVFSTLRAVRSTNSGSETSKARRTSARGWPRERSIGTPGSAAPPR